MLLLNGYFVYFVWSAAAPYQFGRRDEALANIHNSIDQRRTTTCQNASCCPNAARWRRQVDFWLLVDIFLIQVQVSVARRVSLGRIACC
jgi:hypothetical protein